MRVRTYLAAGALGLSAIVGVPAMVAAQNLPPAPSPFGPTPQKPPLFGLRPSPQQLPRLNLPTLPRTPSVEAQRMVVCGMTVIQAPNLDPKSIKRAPDDKRYTMRVVPPPMCGSTSVDTVQPAPEPAR